MKFFLFLIFAIFFSIKSFGHGTILIQGVEHEKGFIDVKVYADKESFLKEEMAIESIRKKPIKGEITKWKIEKMEIIQKNKKLRLSDPEKFDEGVEDLFKELNKNFLSLKSEKSSAEGKIQRAYKQTDKTERTEHNDILSPIQVLADLEVLCDAINKFEIGFGNYKSNLKLLYGRDFNI